MLHTRNRMAWNHIVESLGGTPVYWPTRQKHEPPLLVLHDTGLSLAEQLYDLVAPVLEYMGKIGLLDLLNINGDSILDPLESAVWGFAISGATITVPVFSLCLIIAGYLSGKLTKNTHVSVGVSPSVKTAHDLLVEYFGTDLIF